MNFHPIDQHNLCRSWWGRPTRLASYKSFMRKGATHHHHPLKRKPRPLIDQRDRVQNENEFGPCVVHTRVMAENRENQMDMVAGVVEQFF